MTRSHLQLAETVRERIDEWHASGRADARGMIAEHPELRDDKSLYLDVVLAEYAIRVAAGNSVSHREFCDQFADHRASIVHMLEVEDFVDRCPPPEGMEAPDRWPQLGDTFLEYEIVEPLGRGGLARVYLARELPVGGRFVVLKVSPFGRREADALGRVEHKGIVPIHSVKEDAISGLSAICMPLLGLATGIDLLDAAFPKNGESPPRDLLMKVARRTRPLTAVPMPPERPRVFAAPRTYSEAIAGLGLELAEGLAAAHARRIMHRDIKPSNILLAWSGQAMLLDFNLSTSIDGPGQRLGGTLAYMPPEVIESVMLDKGLSAAQFDPRCDIFSLGTVLYELLAGRLPHGAGSELPRPGDYAGWLLCKQQAPAAFGARSQADPRLAAIALKCLALNPTDRFQSADELVAALREYLRPLAQLRRLVVRRRREFVLSAIAAGITGVAAAVAIRSRPTELEVLHRQGLTAYSEGKFGEAAECFSRCLELKPGWPDAVFGRAQALRGMGKFKEARNEFLGLKEIEPAWCFAFAGYCNMRVNDYRSAYFDFVDAQRRGFENIDFLMNFAEVQRKSKRFIEAEALYAKILTLAPSNTRALRELVWMRYAQTANDLKGPPDVQMLQSALEYRRVEQSFDGSYLCALVFGHAATKDSAFEDQAIHYLGEAMRRGLPKHKLDTLPARLKRLLPHVDAGTVEVVGQRVTGEDLEFARVAEPPMMAEWTEFERRYGRASGLLAATR